ncbi:hypothetical protein [Microbulbifer sp. 2205BS26-8]|uniref:hypothetical protein n=1 Tax=Microbulbifer sp. 2205BS26-8 TaxID=3064386 RepID=UPI00273F26B0|nr:hypothetical protein [Microbulbifer sp. 2205BS26-8]MDP5210764.1 hypothetical protein [Microbulbifer sp. 2205BS26-8]
MYSNHPKIVLALVFFLTLLVSSCTQLAPRYDAELYSDLTEVNVELMQFFSSVTHGTNKNTYTERVENYHALIGRIDALAMQSNTRPIPNRDTLKQINHYLDATQTNILFEEQPPSVTCLQRISTSLNRMREEDEDKGLHAGAVTLFKNEVLISMDQALTYESFLHR